MKIFRIDRDASRWPQAAASALDSPEAVPAGVLPARLVADSAVVRNNRPVFIPDFAREGWVVEVRPAVHIGRLGKFISTRFASRYVEGFSLVACVRPCGDSVPDALTDSFDGALTAGEMMPLPQGGKIAVGAVMSPLPGRAVSVASAVEKECLIELTALHIDDTIALLSRYATLKSGDMVLPASVGLEFPLQLDCSLVASVDGREALSLRLK